MKINKTFIRIALATGLIGLAACGSSDSSDRIRNTILSDGSICYTPEERAGLIEIAQPREQQDGVEYQAAILAQPEVIGQPEIKAQAGVAAQVAPFDIAAVTAQPEVPFQAAVPDQDAVPAREAHWLHFGFVWSDSTVRWMANRGSWTWINERLVRTGTGSEMVLVDATPARPAVKGKPEVPFQAAVPSRRAYLEGDVITEALPEIVGQPEVKAQPAVEAQPEVPAREEIKFASKEEVIEEINAVVSCPETTVVTSAIPSPISELNFEPGEGDTRIAKLIWTPDAADTEEYSVVIQQNERNSDAVSRMGKSEFTSVPLKPECTDVGQFIVTRTSDSQLMAVVKFNHPDQDLTDCEPSIQQTPVVNETTSTEVPKTTDTSQATDGPEATDAPATTLAPVAGEASEVATTDTTTPITTDAPAASDSSSSNNILLYILGLIVVAGAGGFFVKKKLSTK